MTRTNAPRPEPLTASYGKFNEGNQSPLVGAFDHTHAKILVPRFRKLVDDLLGRLSRYFHARMHDVSQVARASRLPRLPRQLTHCASTTPSEWSIQPLLDPAAIRDHVAYYGIHRLQRLRSPAGCQLPRAGLRASDLPVNIRKFVPTRSRKKSPRPVPLPLVTRIEIET